jgi:hypothetical protein
MMQDSEKDKLEKVTDLREAWLIDEESGDAGEINFQAVKTEAAAILNMKKK